MRDWKSEAQLLRTECDYRAAQLETSRAEAASAGEKLRALMADNENLRAQIADLGDADRVKEEIEKLEEHRRMDQRMVAMVGAAMLEKLRFVEGKHPVHWSRMSLDELETEWTEMRKKLKGQQLIDHINYAAMFWFSEGYLGKRNKKEPKT